MEPSRSIPRRLFSLSWPVIGLNVLNVLSLAVDTAMCGRLPNAPQALEALGFSTQVVFLLMVAMMGLTVGTVAFVSRAHGADDEARVNHLLHQSTQLTVLVALGVAVVGNLFADDILRLLGASEAVVGLGLDYLRPLLTFTVFYYLNLLYAAALRSVGNTRLPFLVALFALRVHIQAARIAVGAVAIGAAVDGMASIFGGRGVNTALAVLLGMGFAADYLSHASAKHRPTKLDMSARWWAALSSVSVFFLLAMTSFPPARDTGRLLSVSILFSVILATCLAMMHGNDAVESQK